MPPKRKAGYRGASPTGKNRHYDPPRGRGKAGAKGAKGRKTKAGKGPGSDHSKSGGSVKGNTGSRSPKNIRFGGRTI